MKSINFGKYFLLTQILQNLLELDTRLLRNYYKSLGFYDVKINSNSAEIRENENANYLFNRRRSIDILLNKISTNVDSVFDKELFFFK